MTEMADVPVSACPIPLVVGDIAPVGVLVVVVVPDPSSDPLADAAELGAPPARAELREYIEETDIRFASMSDMEGRWRRAASGSCESFDSSLMMPGERRGVSTSSTATLSVLVRLLTLMPRLKVSRPFVRWL